jgi:hypothetical protein
MRSQTSRSLVDQSAFHHAALRGHVRHWGLLAVDIRGRVIRGSRRSNVVLGLGAAHGPTCWFESVAWGSVAHQTAELVSATPTPATAGTLVDFLLKKGNSCNGKEWPSGASIPN